MTTQAVITVIATPFPSLSPTSMIPSSSDVLSGSAIIAIVAVSVVVIVIGVIAYVLAYIRGRGTSNDTNDTTTTTLPMSTYPMNEMTVNPIVTSTTTP